MKPTECTFNPRPMIGLPIGQFHCPKCGEMCIAGLEHPGELDDEDWAEYERLEELIQQEESEQLERRWEVKQ